jgi:hypothetical protein
MTLLADALRVSRGECPPAHPRAAYLAAAASWAECCAGDEESPTVALARLVANGSLTVDACYRAAAITRLLDGLDPSELMPAGAPGADARRDTWADLLRLLAPHARAGEALPATLRRMLGENVAALAVWLLLLQEPHR